MYVKKLLQSCETFVLLGYDKWQIVLLSCFWHWQCCDVCNFIFYTGAVLELSGSPSYAVLNRPVTLTCTVSQAAGLVDLVTFLKKTDTGLISVLKQEMSKCSAYSNSDSTKYTPSCGSGTDSSSSSIKKYDLYIKKVSAFEVTEWFCQLLTQQTHSNNFNLLLSSKL